MADMRKQVQTVQRAGIDPDFTSVPSSPADEAVVPNDGRMVLVFKNGADPRTVTIKTPAKVAGLDVAEAVVSVPANSERWVGPFPPSVFGRDLRFNADGAGALTFEAVRF